MISILILLVKHILTSFLYSVLLWYLLAGTSGCRVCIAGTYSSLTGAGSSWCCAAAVAYLCLQESAFLRFLWIPSLPPVLIYWPESEFPTTKRHFSSLLATWKMLDLLESTGSVLDLECSKIVVSYFDFGVWMRLYMEIFLKLDNSTNKSAV